MDNESLKGLFACIVVVALLFLPCAFIWSVAYNRGVRDHATGKAAYTEVTLPNGKTEWFVTTTND